MAMRVQDMRAVKRDCTTCRLVPSSASYIYIDQLLPLCLPFFFFIRDRYHIAILNFTADKLIPMYPRLSLADIDTYFYTALIINAIHNYTVYEVITTRVI